MLQNQIGGANSQTDCLFKFSTIRRPDYAIFFGERWQNLDKKKSPIPFAPDVAIAVVSPSEHALEVTRKVRDYLAAGSQEVRLLDAENGEITIRMKSAIRMLQGAEILETPLLPGFSVRVGTLLAS